jgi:hypothetical protein
MIPAAIASAAAPSRAPSRSCSSGTESRLDPGLLSSRKLRSALCLMESGNQAAGSMQCPRCRRRLRPFGHGRARAVRGIGTGPLRVTAARPLRRLRGHSDPAAIHADRPPGR